MTIKSIGFVGLGAMGEPMARNLVQAGFTVLSSANRSRAAIDRLTADGVIEKPTLAGVAAAADAVFVMVRDPDQAVDVLTGSDAVFDAMAPGGLVALMSTVSVALQKDMASKAAARGLDFVDAPVSGLPKRAEAGTLTIMAGGSSDALARVAPAFGALGTMIPCGEVGMGTVAKLANNIAGITSAAIVGEVIRFAQAYGMDKDLLLKIMSNSTGGSFATQNWAQIESQLSAFKGLFVKDSQICIDAARAAHVEMPLGEATSQYDWDAMTEE